MGERRAEAGWSIFRASIPVPPASQRGWIGLVGLLVALVIVAVLAQSVLKSYGLVGGADHVVRGSATQPASSDAARPPAPAAANPMERARSLERDVQRDAQDLSRRIDEQTK